MNVPGVRFGKFQPRTPESKGGQIFVCPPAVSRGRTQAVPFSLKSKPRRAHASLYSASISGMCLSRITFRFIFIVWVIMPLSTEKGSWIKTNFFGIS